MTKTIEGDLSAVTARFAIVVARFNGFLVEGLLTGAVDTLKRHGVSETNITVVRVPGAFEIPIATQKAAQSGQFDAIIALGAVIRGATPHFDFVAGQCASGLSQIALAEKLPVAFGVLTTDTIEQAIERSGTQAGTKGVDAALLVAQVHPLIAA